MSIRQTVRTWSVGAVAVGLLFGAVPGGDGAGLGPLEGAPGPLEGLREAGADGMTLRPVDREPFPYGTDLAFEGDLVVAGSGNYDGPEQSGVHLYQRQADGTLDDVAFLHCPAWHADVDVVPDTPDRTETSAPPPSFAVVSHDSAAKNECGAHAGKAGVGVVDVSDPDNPALAGFAETPHGAHNLTTVGRTGLVYVSSYATVPSAPAGVSVVDVGADPADPPVTVLEFPGPFASGRHPQLGNRSGTPPTAPGCHDITLDLERDRAFCAGITETQIWDISNPRAPVIVEIIHNPAISTHHGAASTVAGDVLVLNDEWLGAAGGPTACLTPRQPAGALWFYDISDPRQATLLGYWSPPEPEPTADTCTSHFFGTLRAPDGRDLVVGSWYDNGLWVVDISTPAAARAVASFEPEGASFWAVYPYRGTLYANSFAPATLLPTVLPPEAGRAAGRTPPDPDAGGVWALELVGYPAGAGSAPDGSVVSGR